MQKIYNGLAALENSTIYNWLSEAIAIILFVLIFNFILKWILNLLHSRAVKQKNVWKESFYKAIYNPLSYYVWFVAFLLAIDLIISHLTKGEHLENRHLLIACGGIIALAWFLLKWKKLTVTELKLKSQKHEIPLDQGQVATLDKLVTMLILFFTLLSLVEVLQWNATTLIAFGGFGGLALAFASQEIIANFFGGFMVYLTRPFSVGDNIQLSDQHVEGTVEEIGWYMTRVRSPNKQPIYIPNSIFSKAIVTTPSRMTHRKIKDTISLRYEDLPKIPAIVKDIRKMLEKHSNVDHSQVINVNFAGFGEHSLDILVEVLSADTDNAAFLYFQEDILLKIATIIEKHEADFAVPTQQVVVHKKT